MVKGLYEKLLAPLYQVDVRGAEIIKYVIKSFQALNVTFANEIGSLCKLNGIDSSGVISAALSAPVVSRQSGSRSVFLLASGAFGLGGGSKSGIAHSRLRSRCHVWLGKGR